MNALHPMIDAPLWAVLLFKVTAILAAAWAGHAALTWANPRWRVLLWRVTAVGLIVLPGVTCLLPGLDIRLARPVVEDVAEEAAPVEMPAAEVAPIEIPTGADWGEPLPFPVDFADGFSDFGPEDVLEEPSAEAASVVMETPAAVASDPVPVPAAATESPEPRSLPWFMLPPLAPLAWLAGVALLALRLCLGHRRLGALANRAKPAPRWVRDEAARVAEAIGCRRRVDVVRSRDIASPVLCGLRRPLLVLPTRMCDEAYRGDLPAILAHELAHAKAYDVPWNALLQVLTAALWFHPLVWRVRKAHLAACELVSDAASASFIGDVGDYCRTLARVAVDAHSPVPASGIAMARTSAIGRRLSALKRHVFHLPLRRRSVLAFGMAAFLGVAVLGAMRFALAEPAEVADVVESVAAADEAVEKPAEEKVEKPEKEEEAAGDEEEAEAAAKPDVMRVMVLDPEGKPLPEAKVEADIWTEEERFKPYRDYETDANGIAEVKLPRGYASVLLRAKKRPFVTMSSWWQPRDLAGGARLPEEYVVRLEAGVSAGGRIVDEQGKPIAGVKVEVTSEGGRPKRGDARTEYNLWNGREDEAVTTDEGGHWQVNVPDDRETTLRFRVFHPDYVSDEHWGEFQNDAGITTEMLLDKTATVTLRRGIVIRGRVTDPEGKPVADAVVAWGDDPCFQPSACFQAVRTDAQGIYRIPALPPGPMTVTVMGEGFSPDLKRIDVSKGLAPVDFTLKPGKAMRLQFVNESGEPVPGVHVQIELWRASKSLYNGKAPNVLDTKIPIKADKDGVWEWTWAPDDPVKLNIYTYGGKDFAPCKIEMSGGDPPRTIALESQPCIAGRVTDTVTGEPIPAFTVVPVCGEKRLHANRLKAVACRNGRLEFPVERTKTPWRLRIEAQGYRTQTSREFRTEDAPRTLDFHLQPSAPVTGLVLDSDGRPVTRARVSLGLPNEELSLDHSLDPPWHQTTIPDAQGRFTFPDPGTPFRIIVLADKGFAMADFGAETHDIGTLRTEPWALIKGTFRDAGRPIENAQVNVNLVSMDRSDNIGVNLCVCQTDTDKDGRFQFFRVPPLPVNVEVMIGPWDEDTKFRSGPSVPLDLKPGQKVELKLGGGGATVSGKVRPTGIRLRNCDYSMNYLIRRSPGIDPPPSVSRKGFDIRKGWRQKWRRTKEGETYLRTLRHWFVKLASDGSFRISGVPAGEYDFSFEIYANTGPYMVRPLARKVVPVTVTEEDVTRGTLSLPEIDAKVAVLPTLGDVPSLKFERPDGTEGSLADFRGRYTLVQFWADKSPQCREHLPELQRLRGRYAKDDLAMIGLSFQEDADVWKASLGKLEITWPQGRIRSLEDFSVSAVPVYWLLSPAGKVVAMSVTADGIQELIEERKIEPVKKEKATKGGESAVPQSKPGTMRVKILDPEGKPLAGAEVRASIWTDEKDFKSRQDYKTGADGIAEVRLPRTYRIVRIGTGKSPFVGMFSRWEKNELAAGKRLPAEYTVRLEAGVSAGGRIVDEKGEPIAGAKVEVMSEGGSPDNGDARTGYDIWLATGEDAAATDQDGRWRIDGVPNDKGTKLRLRAFHPDYVSDSHWGQSQDDSEVTTEMLLNETAVLTLRRGVVVEGRVTDPDGKPVAGAVVGRGEYPRVVMAANSHTVRTDAQGVYRLPALPPGPMTVTVMGEGFAPDLKKVEVSKDLSPVDFKLKPGKVMRLRFINESDEPVPGVSVQIVGWRGGKRLYNHKHPNVLDTKIPIKADENGVWEWTWAPDDPVKLNIYTYGGKDFAPCKIEMSGGDPPRTITLKPEHRITGSVTDAVTGKPIQAFTVIPINVFRKGWLSATRANAKPGKGGRLDYVAMQTNNPLRLRIEAEGYRTQTGPEFRVGDDTPRTQDFRLRPSDPITGVVLDPDGQPVPKAKVLLAIPGEDVNLNYHHNVATGIQYSTVCNNHSTVTDDEGRFAFPDPDAPFIVAAMADGGFATARFAAEERNIGTLRMRPWASVKGRLFDGGRPVKDAGLYLSLLRPSDLDKPRVDPILYQIATDKDGCFEFTRVPPGPVSLRATLGPWREEDYRSGPRVCLDLQPGQNIELELGKPGAAIEGKVCLIGKVPPDLDCTYSINNLVPRSSQVEAPASIVRMGLDILDGWQQTSEKTDTGRIPMKTRRRWFVKLAPDGSFRISGVPAGEYDLSLEIYAKPEGCLVEPLAEKTIRVTVTEKDAAGTLKLPEIEAEVKPLAAVGQTPSLKFTRPDGTEGTLADFRGRFTVVGFWASWCGPCKEQLPALRQLYARSGKKDFALVGLSLDEDAEAWKTALDKLNPPWPQGRLVAPKDSGVSTVPTYWLLDAKGKIMAKAFNVDRLVEEIEKRKIKPEKKEKATKGKESAVAQTGGGTMRVKVLDPEGNPLPGAKVHASIRTDEKDFKSKQDYETDADGIAEVNIPQTYEIVRIWTSKRPFVTMFSHWERNELTGGAKLPEEYTVRLEAGVSAGGRIVNEKGEPLAGVTVEVTSDGGRPKKGDARTEYDMWLANGDDAVTTDRGGRWRIDNVPNDEATELRLMVSHPDYISDAGRGQLQKKAGITTEMLLNESASLELRRGVIVEGRVTGPDEKPIENAVVVWGDNPSHSAVPRKFATDAKGRFRLPAQEPGETPLTVMAPNVAPQLRRIDARPGLPSQDFQMKPGKTAEVRFVDLAGEAVPGVHVDLREWKGSKSIQTSHDPNHPKMPDTGIPRRGDEGGVWRWNSAPESSVKARMYKKGFASCDLEITGGDPPRTVTMKPEHRITGRVTDAETGRPVPDFTVVPVEGHSRFKNGSLNERRWHARPGKDGSFDFLAVLEDFPKPTRLRIEAEGYRTQTGPEFRVGDDSPRTQDFQLSPSPPMAGVVLDPAGQPVRGARVLIATPRGAIHCNSDLGQPQQVCFELQPTEEIDLNSDFNNHQTSTDAEGRFKFPDPAAPFVVVVSANEGFAMADFAADRHDIGPLRLQPWASVRGQFFDGGQPVKDAKVWFCLVRTRDPGRPTVYLGLQGVTDKDGRFAFPRVPPVPVSCRVELIPWDEQDFRSGPRVPLDLKPGQEVDLQLGHGGTTVSGKVKLTGNVPADLDCNYSINHLIRRSPGIEPPPSAAKMGFDVRKGWKPEWETTQEGRTYLNTLQHWLVKLEPDGSFCISGVPAGEYDLSLEIYEKSGRPMIRPLAEKVVPITVTEEDVARGALLLPEIDAKVVRQPAPEFKDPAKSPAGAATHAADVMRVKILDPEGKPLSGAKIRANISTKQEAFEPVRDYTTNTHGLAEIKLPKTYGNAQLWIVKNPYATVYSELTPRKKGHEQPPGECTIRLERTVTAGGRIVDDEGKPIPGAEIQVIVEGGKPAAIGTRARYGGWLARRNPDAATGEKPAAITDADGRWRIDNTPDNPETKLRVLVSHPDYVSEEAGGNLYGSRENLHEEAGITMPMLLGETATVTLRRGVRIQGRVTDPDGKPVKGAFVFRLVGCDRSRNIGHLWSKSSHYAQTGADGRFRLRAIESAAVMVVLAPGWAPQVRPVSVDAKASSEDFQLEKGRTVEFRFVDIDGKPLPNVDVCPSLDAFGPVGPWYLKAGGSDRIDTLIPRKTDQDGVWRWTWAPRALAVYAVSEGLADAEVYTDLRNPVRTVTMKPDHRIVGEVTDAVTTKPVLSFTVLPVAVLGDGQLSVERRNAESGKNGTFESLAKRTDIPLRLRIEAEGYCAATGPEFRAGDNSSRKQTFALRPSPPVIGAVVDAAGLPVRNAEVLLALPSERATAKRTAGSADHTTATDYDGRFRFPDPNEPFTLIARSDDGFAMQGFEAGRHDVGKLRLRPWATVEGRFFDDGRPVKGARIMLDLVRPDRSRGSQVYTNVYQVLTGADGRFKLPPVPPLPVNVRVKLGPSKNENYRSTPHVPLDLQPGQKVDLQLGRGGTAVEGKVKLTGKVPTGLDCSHAVSRLVDRRPGIDPPPSIAKTEFDVRKGWDPHWMKTPEGRTYIKTLRQWFVKPASDGSFRISGVPAGEYDLSLEIYAKPQGGPVEPAARKVVSVTVTEEDVKRGKLTLPEIEAEVKSIAAVGQTPSLKFKRPDGTDGTLTDFRGSLTVVQFWTASCEACKEQLPALRERYALTSEDGIAMVGLSLDEDAEVWKRALEKQHRRSWPQGRLVAPKDCGVSTVPMYWLLDPEGKIIAKAFTYEQLRQEIVKVNEAARPGGDTATIRMKILDPKGKPVPGVKVSVRHSTTGADPYSHLEYDTDWKGIAEFTLPRNSRSLRLAIKKEPYVEMQSYCRLEYLDAMTKRAGEVTVRLRGRTTAGGRIVDERGKTARRCRGKRQIEDAQRIDSERQPPENTRLVPVDVLQSRDQDRRRRTMAGGRRPE